MLSRVADDIYWMYRYLERAENYARFLDVNFSLSLELPPDMPEQWKPLVLTSGDDELFEKKNPKAEKSYVIHFLGFDPENPNSLYNSICNARENARAVRPEITREAWEQINFLYYLVKDGLAKKHWQKKDPRSFFLQVKKGCQVLYGIFDSTVSRNAGWHFGRIGQLIERADKTSRVLDVKYHMLLPTVAEVGSPLDLVQWASLLKSVSSYDMYRKKYGRLVPIQIAEFLIFDRDFPRSILSCLIRANDSIQKIRSAGNDKSTVADEKLFQLKSSIENTNIHEVTNMGLHEYLDNFQDQLNKVSDVIYSSFFSLENFSIQSQSTQ